MNPGTDVLVRFGRALRDAGIPVDTSRSLQFCRAAALVNEQQLFWAGLTTLVSKAEDVAVYERVFDGYFGVGWTPRPAVEVPRVSLVQSEGSDEAEPQGDDAGAFGSWHPSRLELLRDLAFDPVDGAEARSVADLVRRASQLAPSRPVRRYQAGRRGEIDLRGTARRARACGGEPLQLAFRQRLRRLRRIVVVLDVSGSMGEFSRNMLLFCFSLRKARVPCSVFALGTRLTEISKCLDRRDPDESLAAVAEAVPDLQGGTRIGDGICGLLGRRTGVELIRGSVTIVHSDGLETGSFSRLGAGMERLSRLAVRVIWVNPYLHEAGYTPTAGGMSAALPSVDVFVPGGDLAALARLLPLCDSEGSRRVQLRRAGSDPSS